MNKIPLMSLMNGYQQPHLPVTVMSAVKLQQKERKQPIMQIIFQETLSVKEFLRCRKEGSD